MDIFCEYLVKKKSTQDLMNQIFLIIGCILICFLCTYVFIFIFPKFIWLIPPVWGATIYGTVIARRNFSIEYEYIFTNGQLDIDIIKGKAKRKSLLSLNVRDIEYMAPYNGANMSEREVIDAVYDENRRGKYYADFSKSGVAYRLLFQPPEKILDNMKKYNPRNVVL